jgi:MraZ protein
MFRGNIPATVNDKGRLKIPTGFQEILDVEKYGKDFFVTSLDGRSARIYPLSVWLKIEEKLAPLPSMNKAKKELLDRTSYWGQVTEADNQGRILIHQLLREAAGIHGDVAVMGHEEHLEVWNKDRIHPTMSQSFPEEHMETLSGYGI